MIDPILARLDQLERSLREDLRDLRLAASTWQDRHGAAHEALVAKLDSHITADERRLTRLEEQSRARTKWLGGLGGALGLLAGLLGWKQIGGGP